MLSNKLCTELKNIAANFIPAADLDDLVQEVFLSLLTIDKVKLENLVKTKEIYPYFNRMCKLNYYSKTSRYYYTYLKEYEFVSYNSDLTNKALGKEADKQHDDNLYIIYGVDLINDLLNELYWYDRELFKLYVLGLVDDKKYTYTTLAKKTGISRNSIYSTIKGVKKHIAKRINEIRNDL
tara:strand:+ start:24183 stop:24722 length:540 start_codon:yes stop_codon:yes gene_type:complete